ncbi:MAG TPA: hypothetical protein DDW50_09240 [Firmicutes bacterium]|jgi:lipopolysaccharide export system protein LptA|nr:hypothetical protein [Bacillota bacterium]
MKRSLLILAACVCIFTTAVKAGNEPVRAKSDKIWGDNKKKLTYLEGNVRIEQGTTVITSDSTQVDLDQKIATFKDKLRLNSPEIAITADYLEYNFKKKAGTFLRNVIVNRNELKDARGNVTKDGFKLTAENFYFESDTKDFRVQNQGMVVHKDFNGTADQIEYDDPKQELLFTGNATITRPSGERINGDEIEINTKTCSILVKEKARLINEDVTITGDNLNYDYKLKHGVFGNHVIVERAESKNVGGKVTKEHFKLTTVGLYFESGSKNFVTQGKGTLEHKDFAGSAEHIEYNDKLQQMKLKNNAYLKRPKGEEIRGDMITIYIQDKSFTVNNHADINYKVDSDDKDQTQDYKKRKHFP